MSDETNTADLAKSETELLAFEKQLAAREAELVSREVAVTQREDAMSSKKTEPEVSEAVQAIKDAGIEHGPVTQYKTTATVDGKPADVYLTLNAKHTKTGNPVLVCDTDHDIAATAALHKLTVGKAIKIDDRHVAYEVLAGKQHKVETTPVEA